MNKTIILRTAISKAALTVIKLGIDLIYAIDLAVEFIITSAGDYVIVLGSFKNTAFPSKVFKIYTGNSTIKNCNALISKVDKERLNE